MFGVWLFDNISPLLSSVHSHNRVHAWGLDQRMASVIDSSRPETWNHDYYANRLIAGMTRTLCLGRGSSSIRLISPSNYSVLQSQALRIEVRIESFKLGREGSWCLMVEGRSALCIQRDDINLVVQLKPHPDQSRILSLAAMLKSNMYADGLHRSDEVVLFVPPATALKEGIERGGGAAWWRGFDDGMSEIKRRGQPLVIHEIDLSASSCDC